MIPNPPSRQVQSVRTSFDIVQLIQEFGGATINEVAEQLDLAKSTVHNYLGTLEAMGYVVKREETYRLGLRFLTHGMAARNSLRVSDIVQRSLDGRRGDLTVDLVARRGIRPRMFLEKSVPEGSTEIYGSIGKRSNLHAHAPGKRRYWRKSRGTRFAKSSNTTASRRTRRRRRRMRRHSCVNWTLFANRGFAVSDGEAALGVQSIGVAFEDPYGRSHALGVFGHTHDFGGENSSSGRPVAVERGSRRYHAITRTGDR